MFRQGFAKPAGHQIQRLGKGDGNQSALAPNHRARESIAPVKGLDRVVPLDAREALPGR
jgi:hypothetical protein